MKRQLSGEIVVLINAVTRVEVDHKFRASVWQLGFGSVHIKLEAEDYVDVCICPHQLIGGGVN